jgi:hypothetical protein
MQIPHETCTWMNKDTQMQKWAGYNKHVLEEIQW